MSVEDFTTRYPSSVPAEEIVGLNRLTPGADVPAGSRMKRVVGGPG
jgi:hypothetical protein